MAAQVVGNMDWVLARLARGPGSRQMFMYGTFLWTPKLRTQAFFGAASEPPGALEDPSLRAVVLRQLGNNKASTHYEVRVAR